MGEDEFTALFQEMSGRLFSFAAKRLSPQAAEDTVSQTFETVWDKRDECPDDPDARIGWVFTIGRYKILQESDRVRRKHHDNRFIDDFLAHPSSEPDFSDSVVESATGHWIYRQLSTIERELFDVAFMRGVTPERGSAMLGVSVGTFNTRVSRLRARLRMFRAEAETDEINLGRSTK